MTVSLGKASVAHRTVSIGKAGVTHRAVSVGRLVLFL